MSFNFFKKVRLFGLLLFSVLVCLQIAILFLNNKPFDLFHFSETSGKVIKTEQKSNDQLKVFYEYTADSKVYDDTFFTPRTYFKENYTGRLIVTFNNTFPSVNQVTHYTSIQGNYVTLIVFCLLLVPYILSYRGNVYERMYYKYANLFSGKTIK